jgi:hypothetical protein
MAGPAIAYERMNCTGEVGSQELKLQEAAESSGPEQAALPVVKGPRAGREL